MDLGEAISQVLDMMEPGQALTLAKVHNARCGLMNLMDSSPHGTAATNARLKMLVEQSNDEYIFGHKNNGATVVVRLTR